ncbi:RNase P/RNase MRP complex subunit [Blyttiomyces sp. JEL0837]|nr:RNase P/RNase MRP complex subunit [Blyttiomyces sp. JEL0837]
MSSSLPPKPSHTLPPRPGTAMPAAPTPPPPTSSLPQQQQTPTEFFTAHLTTEILSTTTPPIPSQYHQSTYDSKVRNKQTHLDVNVRDEIDRRERREVRVRKRVMGGGGFGGRGEKRGRDGDGEVGEEGGEVVKKRKVDGDGDVGEADGSKEVGGRKKRRFRKSWLLTSREKRESGVFDIPKDGIVTYRQFIPLHQLWRQYMSELLELPPVAKPTTTTSSTLNDKKKPAKAPTPESVLSTNAMTESLLSKVVKADYHGAVLTVTHAKTASDIGISGIMIKETENMFYVVKRDDKVKAIPKKSHIFAFEFGGLLFTLFGNHVKGRPADRIAKKFKPKATVQM